MALSRPRRLLSHTMSLVVLVVTTLTGFVALAPSASAASPTCNFATAGTGTYASTICWFDLTTYNATQATSAAGQAMSMTLPGGYTISYTLKVSGGAVAAATLPTYTTAYLGKGGYTGIAGKPALYQTTTGTTTLATLSNISMVNSSNKVVSGYSLVGADAESTDTGEHLTWTSSAAISSIGALGNSCGGGFTGAGTTSITCTGSSTGNKTGAAIVASEAPTSFSQSMLGSGLEGFSFGVFVSQIQLSKTVVNPFTGDQFNVSVSDPTPTVLGSATTTAGGTTASTGVIPVLAGADGEKYTLSESAVAGNTADYSQSWSCTRNGSTDATLPSGAAGTSAQVTLNIGDFVNCTITNTALSASLSLVKHAGTPVDVNGDGLTDQGDTIPYTFTVTNNGVVTIQNVAVTDNLAGTVTCPQNQLAANASETCTATTSYTVTAADVTAGTVKNTATATGNPLGSSAVVTSPTSSTSTTITAPAPALTLKKTASPTTVSAVGQTVNYSFLLTNSGNVTIKTASVHDTAFSGTGTAPTVTCPAGAASIAPGASVTCTASYVTTQADLDALSITNTATGTGTAPSGATVTSPPSTATVSVTANPALTIKKSESPLSVSNAGTPVTYTYVITNTGNLTLTNAKVVEGTFTGTGTLSTVSCPAGAASLAPGAQVTCTATYTTTQADIDNGTFSNTATASATPPAGITGATTSSPSTVTLPAPPAPALTIKKTVTPTTVTAAGQTLSYSFLITNTGNVTMKTVTASETAFSGTGPTPTTTCPAGAASMAPGAQVTCTASYPVTQADIDAGTITNAAAATGKDPSGTTRTSPTSTATVTATASPSLTLSKTVSPTAVTAAGQGVTYSFLIKNTGNVTLHGVTAAEMAFTGTSSPSAVSCPAGAASLAPGASVTCTSTYTATQGDIDNGFVSNTATATGIDPSNNTVASSTSTAQFTAAAAGSLSLAKSVSPATVSAAGKTVTYSFLITNTGNVTEKNVAPTETTFSGTGTLSAPSCPAGAASLAPGASVTCTASYTTTQADADAGSVTNTATAGGKTPAGVTTTSAASSTTLTITPTATLSVVKSASPTTVSAAGQTVAYSFLVTNTGTVTLHGASITEGSFSGTGIVPVATCPTTSFAPGGTVTCTASYTVTQADMDAGTIINSATASAKDPGNTTRTSSASAATVTATPSGSLTVTKSAAPTTVTTAGTTVNYSFVVKNTGNVTLHGVLANELTFTGSGAAPTVTCPAGAASMAPGAQVTCTASYTVTQTDIDTGSISNSANATGKTPANATVTAPTSTAKVTATRSPSISLLKSASPSGPNVLTPGEVISYSFLVTNTGNVTETNVTINDSTFTGSGTAPTVTCPAGAASLAPGAQVTCTASYTVTQTDVDNGTLSNTATASATPPTGVAGPTVSAPSSVTMPQAAQPALVIKKTVSPTAITAAGQTVGYSFVVTNTGNVTMHGVTVVELAFGGTGTAPTATCPAGAASMTPGAQVTCTASYTATQADVDAGSVSNTADATGLDPSNTLTTSATSTAKFTATASPSLTLAKTASPSTITAAGQTITYTFVVTNTGNVSESSPSIAEGTFSGTGTVPAATCPSGSIAPGAQATCTATYKATQADLDAGAISNTATASATPPTGVSGPTVSPPSTAVVTATPSPALTIAKTASPSTVTAAGQTVTYSFKLTNTGNVTITNASITESAFSGTGILSSVTCPGGVSSIAPGVSVTCTATYSVTQADADTGTVTNTAVATGKSPAGATVTAPGSTATVTITPAPALTLTKSASPSTVSAAGQAVTYSFLITNTGNVTLHGASINEGAFSGGGALSAATCPTGSVAPSGTLTCTATYTTTQADIDAGSFTNTATASAKDPGNTTRTSAASTAKVTGTAAPALTVAKTASPTTVTGAGKPVTYSFLVTNTGTVTLTGVTINETSFSGTGTLSAVTCPATTLAPGVKTTCTATYTTTQADIDAGGITNTATATAKDPGNVGRTSAGSTATVTATASPALTVKKTVSPATATTPGQTVTYSYLVTNTGNVTETNATIVEGTFTGTGPVPAPTCPAGAASLAPGAAVTCTATYKLTQADVDAGSISNSATASATPPAGVTGPTVSTSSTVALPITQSPALTLAKSASPATVTAAGQTVTYSFLVTNSGNVTMKSIAINEGAFTGTGTLSAATCPAGAASLAPAASVTCTATYPTTQADIDATSITNTATASGTDPSGTTDTSPTSTTKVTATQSAALTVKKTVSPATITAAGQTVTYSFLVTNTGNVSVKTIAIAEGTFTGSGAVSAATCPTVTLAPGGTTTCTASYTASQADVDAGSVTNTATASGKTLAGATVTSSGSTATFTATANPALTMTKSVAPTAVSAAGQTVTYSFAITNTGNVTVKTVTAAELSFTGTGVLSALTCPAGAASLAPAASVTCTATYPVTQADIDAGTITNTADATGKDPSGATVTSPTSTAKITAGPNPVLTIKKTASPTSVTAAGQTITYSFVITNTGNVTETNAVVNEGNFTGSGLLSAATCPAGAASLAPGAKVTCTATYTVSQADIDAGTISNTATAVASPPTGVAGPTISSPSTAIVTEPASPALTVAKTASPTTVTAPGQTVTYSFKVTNTGNVTMSGVGINEGTFSGTGTLSAATCPAGAVSLAPAASVTCTATYTTTQADIDAGSISNTATASGTDPSTTTDTSPASTAKVTTIASPALTIKKTVSPTTVTAAGQSVTYSFLVKNTGNVTMTGTSVKDETFTGTGLLSTISCPAGISSLDPGESQTCTATYTVTQADVDAGSVTNSADVTAKTPAGASVTSPLSAVTLAATAAPALTVKKTVAPTTITVAGQGVTYSFLVTNTGNVTMTGIGINEVSFSGTGTLSAATCPAGAASLAPAASVTCTATYTTTQADVDAGTVTNTATATGKDPSGTIDTSPASAATLTATASPALTVKKTSSPTTFNAVGQTLTYSFLVTNTGNVTLTNAAISEGVFTGSGALSAITCPAVISPLSPGESDTCTATYSVTQADLDAGSVSNTATATAKDPSGTTDGSPASTVKTTAVQSPTLAVAKTASPTTMSSVGQTITYSFKVTNTGNVTMKTITVNESTFSGTGTLSAATCPAGAASLAPAASVTCTATYAVTQADLDAGSVTNTATASGKDPAGATDTSPASTAKITTAVTAKLTVSKTVAPTTITAAGQSVTYSFKVTNSGNVTLTGTSVKDETFSGTGILSAITCPAGITPLAPGASVTCTATYSATQADVDTGTVTNSADATGKTPANVSVTSAPSTATLTATPSPALTIKKTAAPATITAAGQSVTYSFKVTNTGNVTMKAITVNEGAFSGTGTLSAATCPAGAASLAPAASVTCTATYTTTQADVDAGTVTNSATASGKDPSGTVDTSTGSTATLTTAGNPALTLKKTASPASVTAAGTTVTYSFLITNTGNVTESNVGVTEGTFSGSGLLGAISCPAGAASMAPGASVTCTATYTVTQDDIDAATLSNTATAVGAPPTSFAGPTVSPASTIVVNEPAAPSLTVKKTAAPSTVTAVGQTITYSFKVTNTGNVTLTDAGVNEGAFSGTGALSAATCPAGAASLAPAASVTCTATYTTTQADIDAGAITNTATAIATDPSGATDTSPASTANVTAIAAPTLTIKQTVAPTSVTAAGQGVTFSFVVTNTGNVTVTGTSITDESFSGTGILSSISCPPAIATLAPGASVTCTATYTATQADVDAGSVTNVADAAGQTPAGGPVNTSTSSATFTAASNPSLTVKKSASPTTVSAAGQSVSYSFLVTNTGNVTLHGIAITEGAFSGTGPVPTASCPAGANALAPGAQVTCTATYTVTQADVDSGSIANSATATGLDPSGTPATSPGSVATVTAPAAPALTVKKTSSPTSVSAAGQTVTYSFLVKNTGNVTVTGINAVEQSFSGTGSISTISCPAGAASLAPAATVTCTATYHVTQADLDAGSITNTADATGHSPSGGAVTSPTSTITTTVNADPELNLVKTASPGGPAALVVGQVITFSFLATNTGNVTLSNLTINEGAFTGHGPLSAISCPAGAASLAPGAQVTCTAGYTVVQADVDTGILTNTARAQADPPTGVAGPVDSPPSTVGVPANPDSQLHISKSVSPKTVTNAGQTVTYSFLVTNTGNSTISGTTVEETAFSGTGSMSTVNCPASIGVMSPGVSVTCTATYTVTQADIDAGIITNTADAVGTDPHAKTITSPASTATITAPATPSLSVAKTASPSTVTAAGQKVTYSFAVTNTGNVTLTAAAINEGAFTGSGPLPAATCPAGAASIAPGATVTCTASYTVTQTDVDAGSLSNTATASATDPAGTTDTSAPSTATVAVTATPALTVKKTAAPTTVSAAGQKVTYSFLVTNTGNVTETGLTVNEESFTGSGTLSAITCPAGAASLAPGAKITCTATYFATQADIDAGSVSNSADVTGTDPAGDPITSPTSSTTLAVTVTPGLSVVKSASPTTLAAGELITYSFKVTNTGNVTETNATIVEGAFSGSGTLSAVTCPAGAASLIPGASVTCTAKYTVTQADVDSGDLTNSATATANPPTGVSGPTVSPRSTADVPTHAAPTLTLTKTASPGTVTAAGQTITYSFVITNTGNVTETNATVVEGTFTGTGALSPISCPAGASSLAPGDQVTCTATYTTTQADIDAGTLSNTATAHATPPTGTPGPTVSPGSTIVVDEPATPALTVDKSAAPATVSRAGDAVTYSFLVTNTGNVTVDGVTIDDSTFSGTGALSAIACPTGAAALAPGDQVTCTATYSVTQADIDAGSVTNTADATGTSPDGSTVTSPGSSATVTVAAASSLTLKKTASPSTVTAAGQTVTYSFTVTNSGSVTMHGISVDDTLFSGTGTLSAVTCPAGAAALAPATSVTCTATYTVTQADVDAGTLTNTAEATGTTPGGTSVTSPTSTATLTITPAPALTVVKSATPAGPAALTAGELITYTYVVTNTGNVSETTVVVDETSFTGHGTPSAITCPAGAASLAPGDQLTCTSTYTVLQSDVDTGTVVNTAEAAATSPGGTPGDTVSPPSSVSMPEPALPALKLVKTASPTTVTKPGQKVTYTFVVTNTGNVTVSAMTIAEGAFTGHGTLSAVSCPAGAASMAPGAIVTCTASYQVTQADLDAGTVSNTATATGQPPGGRAGTVVSPASRATVTSPSKPALKLHKTASPSTVSTIGQTVTYSFQVTNIGNETLHSTKITDQKFSGTGQLSAIDCPPGITSLAPGATVTCTATYTVTAADIKAGTITNTATATAKDRSGGTVTSSASKALVEAEALSKLGLVKQAHPVDVNHDGVIDKGDRVDWTIVATDLGAAPIAGIVVNDPTAGSVSCPKATLAPDESMTCTVPSHTITAADVSAGIVRNVATAHGVLPSGPPITSLPARASVKAAATPVTPPGPPGGSGSLPFTGFALTKTLTQDGLLMLLFGGILLGLARIRRRRVA